ncbi:hypothetical protein LCGC14_2277200 [marine sediment metagenome]|uniref:Uncharacterized protein n=1 Tax=marine sediment metagenome TaxID=412755 RepID=A0A0F9FQH3_9ZZZZ
MINEGAHEEQTIAEKVMEILRNNGYEAMVINSVDDIATPELEDSIKGEG